MDLFKELARLKLKKREELILKAEGSLEKIEDREAYTELSVELGDELSYDSQNSDGINFDDMNKDSQLEMILEEVNLMPKQLQEQLRKRLVMNHYGIKSSPIELQSESYNNLQRKNAEVSALIDGFGDKVSSYLEVLPNSRINRKNLSLLANAGIIDLQDTQIYLAAIKNVDKVFNKENLRSVENETRFRRGKNIAYVTGVLSLAGLAGAYFAGGNVAAILSSSFTGAIGGFMFASFPTFFVKKNPIRYQKKIIKHLSQKAQNINSDIGLAQEYASLLNDQVCNPTRINSDYLNKYLEVEQGVNQAKKYFSKVTRLLEEIK
jgi:hypothetical protein